MMSLWIDVTRPLRDGMPVWPGDPPVRFRRVLDAGAGDPATVTALELSTHSGTHVDAPRHFLPDGATVDELPPDVAIGLARVVAVGDQAEVRIDDLEPHRLQAGDRILLRTRNSDRPRDPAAFASGCVSLSEPAARWLAAHRISLVGIDGPSIGAADDGAATHRVLLEAGIWIVEDLDLSAVGEGDCEMVCLPLRLEGLDGSPVRCLLRPLGSREP
jgi:arylformamidase